MFDDDRPIVAPYREFTQHFPRPGWVEHDPAEIWEAVRATLKRSWTRSGADEVAAIGITNQRETAVAWDRSTGQPYGNAIVWQDRRTAGPCDELARRRFDLVRQRTGLVLDPYFSGTKWEWHAARGRRADGDDLAFGTVDCWVIWNLTGGEVHATDATNASRTMLFDIRRLAWDDELCELLHVPRAALPDVVASSGRIGVTSGRCGVPAGIAVSGIAGDQQAALFGQACVRPGMAKNTYGTGQLRAAQRGLELPGADRGDADDRGVDPRRRHRRLRASKAPSSRPARPSSGCATGSGVIASAAETGPLAGIGR